MVFKWLSALVGGMQTGTADGVGTASRSSPAPTSAQAAPPTRTIEIDGLAPFDVPTALSDTQGLPIADWSRVQRWVDPLPAGEAQSRAWSAVERAWLEHLGAALGPHYRLRAQDAALLLSSLGDAVADATLSFVNKTEQRILSVLDGVAAQPELGQTLLVVFDDEETYYRYVSIYYPEAGEFAASSGMYIDAGCGHFVTVKADLHAIEPVIVHELTHASLAHLPIPAWLNEGLAVNTEQRLSPPRHRGADPRQMHARHLRFWGEDEIQQFWSGKSFLRNDEGNELSYDLARVLVSQFASDWPRFRAFALAADLADGGAAAALEHLDLELGIAACAVLEQTASDAWSPHPELWRETPERGAF